MAFVIDVIKWLLWTAETMYEAEFIIPFRCETLVNTPSEHDVAGPMLAHNLRHRPNIIPALVRCLVFAGLRSTQKNIVLCPLWSVLECFENLRNYK